LTTQSPALFFDTPFKYEHNPNAASVIGRLAIDGDVAERARVPQPYSDESGRRTGDLVGDLLVEIEEATRGTNPVVWIVAAPAGYGKSVSFRSLFSRLYARFREKKKRHETFPRPLPMMADHLREAAGPNLRGLVDAFLRTDIAGHATGGLFSWMIQNRTGIWMLDGLDEVIASDDEFAAFVLDRLTSADSSPLIVVSVRDSLLETSNQLGELLEYASEFVRVRRLSPWSLQERRAYAWTRLVSHLPRSGEPEPAGVSRFVDQIKASKVLGEVTSTPFYCHLFFDLQATGSNGTIDNQYILIDAAIDQMCRREYAKKGPITESTLPLPAFREWLEDLAVDVHEDNGISAEGLRELADLVLVLAEGLDEGKQAMLVDQMTAIPFITRNPASGKLEFSHELLGEYLAACRFAREARLGATRLASRLSRRRYPADSILLATLASKLRNESNLFIEIFQDGALTAEAVGNLVQILALLDDGVAVLRESGHLLENADLSGVDFGTMNLEEISLAGCDLSYAKLERAKLVKSRLQGAQLRNTALPPIAGGQLRGAEFGNCENFESVVVDGGRRIDTHRAFLKWMADATQTREPDSAVCLTCQQVRHLFGKFVRPNGEARRHEIDWRGVQRGKQVEGAPEYSRVVDAALEFGYLERQEVSGGIGRARGEKYGEMVGFMKSLKLSPGLVGLLDSLCPTPACRHTA
jgi:hypothetical protein